MSRRMSELLDRRAQRGFVGREAELAALRAMLTPQGPRVAHVHGIAGIGKSALLQRFATEAEASGASVIRLDCRQIEPTTFGLRQSLGKAVGDGSPDVETLADRLGQLGAVVVVAFDTYEVFRLLDTWLRQVFIPLLSDNVRVLFVGRLPPSSAWHATPGWGDLLQSVPVAPLSEPEARTLLHDRGVAGKEAAEIAHSTHGHPLTLMLAAAALREGRFMWPQGAPLQHALETLTDMFLADVGDPVTRQLLEGVGVTRRITVSLLGALFPELTPRDAYERLRNLPFIDVTEDGLIIHDAVRDAISVSLHASDPQRHLEYRRAAWRQLIDEAESAAGGDLWRYTADMLYLIENPVVREAFFPSGTSPVTVESAQPGDESALADIVETHDGPRAAEALLSWWHAWPQSFSVVRNPQGQVVGLYCKLRSDQVGARRLLDDPITAQWYAHLKRRPMARGDIALFCRRWLSVSEGDSPGEVQAAVWLDLKRTYMELRPALRRVYLTVCDIAAYASVARRLGFEVLTERDVELDGSRYHSAMLDFGPASVDGWLADVAAAELGIRRGPELLDMEARELVLAEGRVALTPLEFGVMHHLVAQQGKAVSRTALLRDVWGTTYEGGSNVVDAVMRTLRRKLGYQATRVETVTGVGYRLKHPS